MNKIVSDNLHDVHRQLMSELLYRHDFESSPRGKPVKEILGASFVLTDPRARLIDSPARKLNYGFAVGELCWYVRGDNDLATMTYYNKRMPQFSDDGRTINSAYGYRMFHTRWYGAPGEQPYNFSPNGRGQLDEVMSELVSDPDSRRAVLHINEPLDLRKATFLGSKDVPCTLSIQLLIRDRLLHMHVVMRSNDIAWGFPYDVFSFTCLQEAFLYMLQERGAAVDGLGHYHHTVGSLHLYSTHYGMAEEVAGEDLQRPAPMAPFTLDGLRTLAEDDEPSIRNDGWTDIIGCPRYDAHEDSIGWMFQQLVTHKNKRIREAEPDRSPQEGVE